MWEKLLNAVWPRQSAFFLNHEGTFGSEEGTIIWCWLSVFAVCSNKFSDCSLTEWSCWLYFRNEMFIGSIGQLHLWQCLWRHWKGIMVWHHAGMQFPLKICPLCDKQVIARALWAIKDLYSYVFSKFSKNYPHCFMTWAILQKLWKYA